MKKEAEKILLMAEQKAEKKFLEAIEEDLPRELGKRTKEEKKEFLKRKLRQLREGQKANFFFPFDVERHNREELLKWLNALLRDKQQGLNVHFKSEEEAVQLLSERMKVAKLIWYLVDRIDNEHPQEENFQESKRHLTI
jgi:hypothetical protein